MIKRKYVIFSNQVFYDCVYMLLVQPVNPEVDIAVLQRLREMVNQLRDQLRTKEREINNRNVDIDNVSVCHIIYIVDLYQHNNHVHLYINILVAHISLVTLNLFGTWLTKI